MSVFDGDNNQNTAENAQQESFVKKLVESKGEKWSDPEVIAKGKVEADAYIDQLKSQIEELRKLAEQNRKVDDLIAKIEQKATQPTSVVQSKEGGTEETKTRSNISEDQIQSLVEKALTDRERNRTSQQNVGVVDEKLQELYGTEATSVVKAKAQELGVSLAKLQEIASESPSAFFRLIGEKEPEFKPMVSGTIRTESVSTAQTGERNNNYYQEVRKKNPVLFGQLQEQMLKDRIRLGDKFYK
jgi:hypothetical protein